jgi:hypothetical protein
MLLRVLLVTEDGRASITQGWNAGVHGKEIESDGMKKSTLNTVRCLSVGLTACWTLAPGMLNCMSMEIKRESLSVWQRD